MSIAQNKDIVHRYFDEIQKGNLEVIDELIGSQARFYVPGLPPSIGREGQREWATMLFEAFPGACIGLDDMVAEGNKVAVRWTFSGTQRGEFEGIPPTGKQVTISGISIYRLENGKIEEGWSNYDMLGALQQLGVVSVPWRSGH